MFNKILLMSCTLLCFTAYGGERGYYLFVSGNDEGKGIYQDYRKTSKFYRENEPCWQKRTGSDISISYVNTVPEGITSQLIADAMRGKSKSISSLRHKLLSFHDDEISHGFDAMVHIVKHHDGATLTLIPLKGEMISETVKPINFQSLDLSLCQILVGVDNYFSP